MSLADIGLDVFAAGIERLFARRRAVGILSSHKSKNTILAPIGRPPIIRGDLRYRQCCECDRLFQMLSHNAKRCRRCRKKDRARRDGLRCKNPIRATCKRCDRPIQPTRQRLYCGSCRVIVDRELGRGFYHRRADMHPPIICCDCGKTIPNMGGRRKRCVNCQVIFRRSYHADRARRIYWENKAA